MSNPTPTIATLQRALLVAEQIAKLEAELAQVLGGTGPAKSAVAAVKTAKKGRRTVSPEARQRIAAAQKARWAKIRGDKAPTAAAPATKQKRKGRLTPAGRASLAEKMRARWAARKAGTAVNAPAKSEASAKPVKRKGRRTVSPEGRARIAAAAQKRWSKSKAS